MGGKVGETLGEQIIRKFDGTKNECIELGTISEHYQKNTFPELLETIQRANKNREGKYYIQIFARDHVLYQGGTQISHATRKTRPLPMWGTTLFSYTNPIGPLLLEWCLPTEDGSNDMLKNPSGFDPELIHTIRLMKSGKLI